MTISNSTLYDRVSSKIEVVHKDLIEILNSSPEVTETPTYIVAHAIRHASVRMSLFQILMDKANLTTLQALHKDDIGYIVNKDIYDPHLTTTGKEQCLEAGRKLIGVIHPHLILTSPLSRGIGTARRIFPLSTDLNGEGCTGVSHSKIWALPALMNHNRGPNGNGSDLKILRERYPATSIRLDYVSANYNDKKTGPWSDNRCKGRVGNIKLFLRDLVVACPKRRFEVALMSHGSIFVDLVGEADYHFACSGKGVASHAFGWKTMEFRKLTAAELKMSKENAMDEVEWLEERQAATKIRAALSAFSAEMIPLMSPRM